MHVQKYFLFSALVVLNSMLNGAAAKATSEYLFLKKSPLCQQGDKHPPVHNIPLEKVETTHDTVRSFEITALGQRVRMLLLLHHLKSTVFNQKKLGAFQPLVIQVPDVQAYKADRDAPKDGTIRWLPNRIVSEVISLSPEPMEESLHLVRERIYDASFAIDQFSKLSETEQAGLIKLGYIRTLTIQLKCLTYLQ